MSPGLACFRVSVVPLVPGKPEKKQHMYESVIMSEKIKAGKK